MARAENNKKRLLAAAPGAPLSKRVKASASNTTKARASESGARNTVHNASATTVVQGNLAMAQLQCPPTRKLQVYVFGEGSAGELGLGNSNAVDVVEPRLNPNLADIVNIATGGMHAAALTADKAVLTWGVNDEKALGRDTTWDGGTRDDGGADDADSEAGSDLNPREAMPTAIPADSFPLGTEIVQLAAGDSTTFLLTRDGLVYGCGTFRDLSGVLGFTLDLRTNKPVETQATPALVPNLKNIKALSVGADYALALDVQGRVFAWGSGQQQQLGRRIVERRRLQSLIPHQVELPKRVKVVSIHAGIDHAFAIDTKGDTWAWGLNNFAQTGIANRAGEADASVVPPRKVPSLAGKKMRMVHGGRHHSIGVTHDGECLVWGRMDGGQIGLDVAQLPLEDARKVVVDGRGRPRILLQPTAVPIPKCTHVTAGPDHCIAITEEGEAYSWGINVNHQCGQAGDDDVLIAKRIDEKAINSTKFCWAGAGGQYSMLAAYQDDAERLTNGVH